MLRITTNRLLLVGGIVWIAAGSSVASVGLAAYAQAISELWLFFAALGVFLVFFHLIFLKIVHKNERRIRSYPDQKTNIFKFLDKKGYIIMASMMALGFVLRITGLVPGWFFAFFYSGLGLALLLAGLVFLVHYARNPHLRYT